MVLFNIVILRLFLESSSPIHSVLVFLGPAMENDEPVWVEGSSIIPIQQGHVDQQVEAIPPWVSAGIRCCMEEVFYYKT